MATVSFAEKRTYIEKKIIFISKDGKIERKSPFKKINFDIQKEKITISGSITKDSGFDSKGDAFEWTNHPYTIFSKGQSLPKYPSPWKQWLFSLLDKKLANEEPETVIMASGSAMLLENYVPSMLILGDSYYFLVRPLAGMENLQIAVGKRVED